VLLCKVKSPNMLNITALFIPVLLLAIAIEWFVTRKKTETTYTLGNTMQNMSIGALDQIGSLFYFTALYISLDFSYQHFRIFQLPANWLQWVLAFIAVDFLSYWYHRLSHRTHILWAGHVTHHSSPHFNLSNGFRTSLFQGLNRVLFWALLPIFGFSPWILLITLKVSGIYDFVQHTKWFPRIQWLEYVIITPSLHRVHHGKNDLYVDKNYGSVFSIWDRLFGTFQEETEPVVYGIKAEYNDTNPLLALGFHYIFIWKEIRNTSSLIDKIRFPFMPPDWVPSNRNKPMGVRQNTKQFHNFNYKPMLFEFIVSVIGFITIFALTPILPTSTLIICYLIILHFMIQNSRIINFDIPPPSMRKNLIINSIIVTGCFICTIVLQQHYFGLLLIICAIISAIRLIYSAGQKETKLRYYL
jgi:sterol desaturase/sphingolipid hydroxylase (fatty acid hydroxylase superfamily)